MKKKLSKVAGWVLFGLIALTIIVLFEGRTHAQNVPFRVSTANGHHTVTVFRSSKDDKVVWTTYGVGSKFYSELGQATLNHKVEIPFDDTVTFWVITQYKTTSVSYISPYNRNYDPVILIDGVNTRTGISIPRKYWAYEEIVPLINSYYGYDDEDDWDNEDY